MKELDTVYLILQFTIYTVYNLLLSSLYAISGVKNISCENYVIIK